MVKYIIFIFLILFLSIIVYNLFFYNFEKNIINCKKFIYNIAWEDPKIDFRYLNINRNDNILMITTAGCNILNTLLQNPNKIVTVDISKCQNALLDLKIASIKNLNYEDFWKLFGVGKHNNIKRLYIKKLRKSLLLNDSKIFWDNNLSIFKKGLYVSGGSGIIGNFLYKKYNLKKLTEIDDVDEQHLYYKNEVEPYLFNTFTRIFMEKAAIQFGGVPQNQIDTVCNGKCKKDEFFNLLKKNYHNLTKLCSIKNDNYFIYGILRGEFTKNNCPEYLKEKNFQFLKENVHKIEIRTSDVTNYLKNTKVKFTKFILLDHLDWFKDSKNILEEFYYIKKQSIPGKSSGIFRSGNARPWFLKDIEKLNYINIKDYSFESKNDRLGTYPGFYFFEIN